MLVLDRRHVRHLGRPGHVLMLRVRFRDAEGAVREATFASGEELPRRRDTPAADRPTGEWYYGVTYERSRDARIEESGNDVYALVYDAERPELFLKDAGCRRTVGPNEPIAIRSDSTWNVPEPEIGLVLGEEPRDRRLRHRQRRLVARHRGSKPALPAPGQGVRRSLRDRPGGVRARGLGRRRSRICADDSRRGRGGALRRGDVDRADEADIRRTRRLAHPRQPRAAGYVLLTGTGLVPPDDFTLLPGHLVEIYVPEIGTLTNPVVSAADLIERSTPKP